LIVLLPLLIDACTRGVVANQKRSTGFGIQGKVLVGCATCIC
jgi:hypothetical protein